MAVLQPYKGDYYLWHYLPSVPAAIIFLLVFLGCTFGLIWKSWRARIKFGIPFIIGTFCQLAENSFTDLLWSALLTACNSRSSRLWRTSIRLRKYRKHFPIRYTELLHLARPDLDGSHDLHDFRKTGARAAC